MEQKEMFSEIVCIWMLRCLH